MVAIVHGFAYSIVGWAVSAVRLGAPSSSHSLPLTIRAVAARDICEVEPRMVSPREVYRLGGLAMPLRQHDFNSARHAQMILAYRGAGARQVRRASIEPDNLPEW